MKITTRVELELFDGMPEIDDTCCISLKPYQNTPARRFDMFRDGWSEILPGQFFQVLNREDFHCSHNLITQYGRDLVADQLAGASALMAPAGMKLGTNGMPASLADTDIRDSNPPAGAFQGFDVGFPSRSGNVTSWRCTWAPGQGTTGNLREIVMKSADGSQDAVNRVVFPPRAKLATSSLVFTVRWTVTE